MDFWYYHITDWRCSNPIGISFCKNPPVNNENRLIPDETVLMEAFLCRTKSYKKYMVAFVILECFSNILNKEEQSWRCHTLLFQTMLQSHSSQGSMVLA